MDYQNIVRCKRCNILVKLCMKRAYLIKILVQMVQREHCVLATNLIRHCNQSMNDSLEKKQTKKIHS